MQGALGSKNDVVRARGRVRVRPRVRVGVRDRVGIRVGDTEVGPFRSHPGLRQWLEWPDGNLHFDNIHQLPAERCQGPCRMMLQHGDGV